MTYVLDACAILAYLRDEPGSERLVSLIADGTNELLVHAVNLA